jgi:choline dehydrogenase-like flavoprotein
MVYSRGSPADYDEWVSDHGCVGWGWGDLLPCFQALERHLERTDAAHGRDGELAVSDQAEVNPLTFAFLEACAELGLPPLADIASGTAVGAGLLQHTVARGRRCSAAHAFLHPIVARPNLTIRSGAMALRLSVANGRADGVVLGVQGSEQLIHAGEVIVAAGAVGSPKLLLLSGIGPADELTSLGIPPVHDLVGVGRGLADHLHLPLVAGCLRPVSIDRRRLAWSLPADVTRYALLGRGRLATRALQAAAYLALERGSLVPDLALHFIPMRLAEGHDDGPGMTVHAALLRPTSAGSVRLASADPVAPALLDPGYLTGPGDLEGACTCFARSQEVLRSRAMARWLDRPLLPDCWLDRPEALRRFVRAHGDTDYHLAASCRMGSGTDTVVDPADLRVRGLDGLRICDSSVFPTLVRGNTNAVAMAFAARAADLILSSP